MIPPIDAYKTNDTTFIKNDPRLLCSIFPVHPLTMRTYMCGNADANTKTLTPRVVNQGFWKNLRGGI
jgi:hypothetical protein